MIEVVAAVIRDADTYLICRLNVDRGGMWEFPGGKVEPGESPREALAREIYEELGVRISVGRQIETAETADKSLRMVSFEATLIGGRPATSTDHDRLEWVGVRDLSKFDWAEADFPTVRALEDVDRRA